MADYPNHPGYKERETSRDAAEDMHTRAIVLQNAILKVLKKHDMTADEVAAAIFEDRLSVRPRLSEMLAKNLVRKTGARRRNASGKFAHVWGLVL